MYEVNMLVVYHQMPAIIKAVKDKLTIELISKKTKKVREKDVEPLLKDVASWEGFSLEVDPYKEAELDEALELLEEEAVPIEDLAEFLYGEANSQTVWNAYRIFEDGVYFKGSLDAIEAQSRAFIEQTLKEKREKEEAKLAYTAFIERLKGKEVIEEDLLKLRELEKIALGQDIKSKILKELHMEAHPMKMHRYLLELGLWNDVVNPYPLRQGCTLKALEDMPFEASQLQVERKDLTHFISYAIDAKETHDPDDAISLDGEYLWVHIADVASLIEPNSELDQEARSRGASLYLPNGVVNMIPRNVIQSLAIGMEDKSPALSFKIEVTDSGEVLCHDVTPSYIHVERITYDEVDERIEEEPFASMMEKIERFMERRKKVGAGDVYLPEVDIRIQGHPITNQDSYLEINSAENMKEPSFYLKNIQETSSRTLVSNAMLLTGEAVAGWLNKNNIPCPYVAQEAPDEIKNGEDAPKTLSEKLSYIKTFKKSKLALSPEPHYGLGINQYVRVTSPLRRYADLLVHQQIRLFLAGKEVMNASDIEEKMTETEYTVSKINVASRLSSKHFKLLYLKTQENKIYDGVLMDKKGNLGFVMLPDIAIEVKVQGMRNMELDAKGKVQITGVDLSKLDAFGKWID